KRSDAEWPKPPRPSSTLHTDLPRNFLLPWWSVMADINGDATAILVRLDEANGDLGWSLLSLIELAAVRARAEAGVVRSPLTEEAVRHLGLAAELERQRRAGLAAAGELLFHPLDDGGKWPWLSAEFADEGSVEFCPSLTGADDEGVCLETILHIVVQLVEDASRALPNEGAFGGIGLYLDRVLDAIVRRDNHLRSRR
ncbi:MAG: hypothetical protein WCJ64_16350, partial [Rhodospirillaceae bacterium]